MFVRSLVVSCLLAIAAASAALAASAAAPARASLAVYEGFRMADGKVVKSDDPTADLSLYVNRGRRNAGAFALAAIGATRIKEFGATRPDVSKLTRSEMADWDDSVNAPTPGDYYVIQGVRGGVYLVQVETFENQGKAASYWKLTFTYEEVALK